MKNLAGVKDCDADILRELRRAGIEAVHGERARGEVAASVTGRLGPFVLWRAWYYWVVEGCVPIEVARELYADPVGVEDVRARGHCGCPPPDEQANWYDADGRRLLDLEQKAQYEQYARSNSPYLRDVAATLLAQNDYVSDPSAVGRGFIELYHIDSEVGLRLFADTVKRHGLDKVPAPVAALVPTS